MKARAPLPPSDLEARFSRTGADLRDTLNDVLATLPAGNQGPQGLARALGLDKVLTSRLLKAARDRDPIAVVHHVPGPEPMRRFYRAARRRGADPALVAAGETAVDAFQTLIREEVGDRSSLDAVISSWLPQARQEFELRRKQSAFKAISQLKGVSARLSLATVLLHPAADGERIDVVWILGLFGIQRWRPGARVKLASRRQITSGSARRPTTLAGESVEGLEGLRLDDFCHAPPAALEVRRLGETVHYLLADESFGRKASSDLLLAEVNLAEMARVPEAGRRGYVFAEVSTPCSTLLFDVLVHEDVYAGATPALELYDTAFDGVVDVNDPARAVDRLDAAETLQAITGGPPALRVPDVPNHVELLRHVFESMGWQSDAFRAYRSRIEYPLYGSQVVVAFG